MEEYTGFNNEEFNRWLSENGDGTHRLNYELNEDSIVFDLGGYKGEWAENISGRYGCRIYIFEPVKDFCNNIKNKFASNNKISAFEFGLGPRDESIDISLTSDSSSIFNTDGQKETIEMKSFVDFLNDHSVENIDLIKINIEGGEYEVLEDLIQNNKLPMFKNIQVQFHRFVPDCVERRNKIREYLSKTHELTYDFEFVWENWKLK